MLVRLRYGGRRVQNCLKLVACVLVAAFYFTFLFRESLNAIEQNKEKAAVLAASGLGSPGGGSGFTALGGSNSNSGSGANSYNNKQYEKLKLPPKYIVAIGQKHMLQWQHFNRQHQQQQHVTSQSSSSSNSPRKWATTTPPDGAQLPPSTLNPVYEYSEEIHSATERELQLRRVHLNDICQRYNLPAHYPPNPWEFFISPGHNLVWCNVFKAASSTWMYYFNILGGYDIRYLQHTESQPLELARNRFPRPELSELLDSLPSSLSFLFVRDPFERIVSAYRNKLEGGRNPYYKTMSHKILNQFRRYAPAGGASHSHKSGPSFDEFLRYLIDQHAHGKQFDEHWAPVYSFCTPCSVNFTIIGKVETFQRDSEFIIRQAGLESLLLGKLPRNKLKKIGNLAKGVKSHELVASYFADVDRETLDQLLNIYRLDFELFDYNYTKYYSYVRQLAAVDTTSGVLQLGRTLTPTNGKQRQYAGNNGTKNNSALPTTTVKP